MIFAGPVPLQDDRQVLGPTQEPIRPRLLSPQSLGDLVAGGEDSDPLPHGDFWDIWTTMEKPLSLRISSGLSLADMTAQTGMDRAALSRPENGGAGAVAWLKLGDWVPRSRSFNVAVKSGKRLHVLTRPRRSFVTVAPENEYRDGPERRGGLSDDQYAGPVRSSVGEASGGSRRRCCGLATSPSRSQPLASP